MFGKHFNQMTTDEKLEYHRTHSEGCSPPTIDRQEIIRQAVATIFSDEMLLALVECIVADPKLLNTLAYATAKADQKDGQDRVEKLWLRVKAIKDRKEAESATAKTSSYVWDADMKTYVRR